MKHISYEQKQLDRNKYDYLHCEGVTTVKEAVKIFQAGCTCRGCGVVRYLLRRELRDLSCNLSSWRKGGV